jgi:hypothetical protein
MAFSKSFICSLPFIYWVQSEYQEMVTSYDIYSTYKYCKYYLSFSRFTKYEVYKNLDFFGSYLSIFLTIFSVIHFNIEFDYQNFLIVLIGFFSCFFSVSDVQWYFFILFSFIFSFISSFFIKEFSVRNFLKMVIKFRLYPLIGTMCLFLSILMQYFFALSYDTNNYPLHHGFWHFLIFLSAGFWMDWNNKIIQYENDKDED